MAGRGGYASYYASQTGTGTGGGGGTGVTSSSGALEQALTTAVAGATQVKYRSESKKGSQRLSVRPATPVDPVTTGTTMPVAAPAIGFFQKLNDDGTLGTNWARVAIVGGGALVVVIGLVAAMKGKRR